MQTEATMQTRGATPHAGHEQAGHELKTTGIGRVQLIVADLDRFITFYRDVFGARVVIVINHDQPDVRRSAILDVGGGDVLHGFELAGADLGELAGAGLFKRGRVDQFALTAPSEAAFEELRERLVELGICNGKVQQIGPIRTLWFTDAEGMEVELAWVPEELRKAPKWEDLAPQIWAR